MGDAAARQWIARPQRRQNRDECVQDLRHQPDREG
jgi:hypothetical protein